MEGVIRWQYIVVCIVTSWALVQLNSSSSPSSTIVDMSEEVDCAMDVLEEEEFLD
jgi:hypothetical protein